MRESKDERERRGNFGVRDDLLKEGEAEDHARKQDERPRDRIW